MQRSAGLGKIRVRARAAVQHPAPAGEFAQDRHICLDFETILELTSYLRVTEAPS